MLSSRRLRSCWRLIRPPCAGWLLNPHWVMRRGGNGRRQWALHLRSRSVWLNRGVAPDRPAFLGTSGFGPLDNISVLERFEEGARSWSAAHGGSVVELHAYALVEQPDERGLKDRLLAELRRAYPELEGASIVAEEWLVNDDCPLFTTGPWEQRLTDAQHPRIALAGDGIRCDFPVAPWSVPQRRASLPRIISSTAFAWPAMISGRFPLVPDIGWQRLCAASRHAGVSQETHRAPAGHGDVRRTRGRRPRACGRYARIPAAHGDN